MRFFGFFGRRRPIRDADALADFIDQQAAFLVQKGIYEYSRARAGHYAKVLFAEKEFQAAVALACLSAWAGAGGGVGRRRTGSSRRRSTLHEKLRGRDFPTVRNYLRVTLCNIHDEFAKRMDAPALAGLLGRQNAWSASGIVTERDVLRAVSHYGDETRSSA